MNLADNSLLVAINENVWVEYFNYTNATSHKNLIAVLHAIA
jgi:hypothetical protein